MSGENSVSELAESRSPSSTAPSSSSSPCSPDLPSCRLITTVPAEIANGGKPSEQPLVVLGGKASCRRKFVINVHLVDEDGCLVNADMNIVASVAYAHDKAPVIRYDKPPLAEPPLFTTFNGVEFPAVERPTRMIAGRASFKLAISLLSSKCDNRLFCICFTPQPSADREGAPICAPTYSKPIRSISRKRSRSGSACATAGGGAGGGGGARLALCNGTSSGASPFGNITATALPLPAPPESRVFSSHTTAGSPASAIPSSPDAPLAPGAAATAPAAAAACQGLTPGPTARHPFHSVCEKTLSQHQHQLDHHHSRCQEYSADKHAALRQQQVPRHYGIGIGNGNGNGELQGNLSTQLQRQLTLGLISNGGGEVGGRDRGLNNFAVGGHQETVRRFHQAAAGEAAASGGVGGGEGLDMAASRAPRGYGAAAASSCRPRSDSSMTMKRESSGGWCADDLPQLATPEASTSEGEEETTRLNLFTGARRGESVRQAQQYPTEATKVRSGPPAGLPRLHSSVVSSPASYVSRLHCLAAAASAAVSGSCPPSGPAAGTSGAELSSSSRKHLLSAVAGLPHPGQWTKDDAGLASASASAPMPPAVSMREMIVGSGGSGAEAGSARKTLEPAQLKNDACTASHVSDRHDDGGERGELGDDRSVSPPPVSIVRPQPHVAVNAHLVAALTASLRPVASNVSEGQDCPNHEGGPTTAGNSSASVDWSVRRKRGSEIGNDDPRRRARYTLEKEAQGVPAPSASTGGNEGGAEIAAAAAVLADRPNDGSERDDRPRSAAQQQADCCRSSSGDSLTSHSTHPIGVAGGDGGSTSGRRGESCAGTAAAACNPTVNCSAFSPPTSLSLLSRPTMSLPSPPHQMMCWSADSDDSNLPAKKRKISPSSCMVDLLSPDTPLMMQSTISSSQKGGGSGDLLSLSSFLQPSDGLFLGLLTHSHSEGRLGANRAWNAGLRGEGTAGVGQCGVANESADLGRLCCASGECNVDKPPVTSSLIDQILEEEERCLQLFENSVQLAERELERRKDELRMKRMRYMEDEARVRAFFLQSHPSSWTADSVGANHRGRGSCTNAFSAGSNLRTS
ncbi:hypothetical protein CBR_g19551 [Chara braunii]|uniref:Uncharacterized protein n=1 Tax=Chara braunii TaxID=69332 RepID=A0A388KYE5_CHABU|nr:hypothetical protein CBR_g19551 [Chara braunii]|eukprot:GBG75038.1 hypothetical protein CBR_g19551 [Chara braunii]